MPKKNIENIHNNIVKAQDIVVELATSLNMDAGEISQRLFSIYMYINNRLTDANVKKEEKPPLFVFVAKNDIVSKYGTLFGKVFKVYFEKTKIPIFSHIVFNISQKNLNIEIE